MTKSGKSFEPLLPEIPSGTRGIPWRDNREVLDGILWVFADGSTLARFAEKVSIVSNVPSSFPAMVYCGTLEKVLTTITEKLEKRGQLNMSECCIDAKFVAAKKGDLCR